MINGWKENYLISKLLAFFLLFLQGEKEEHSHIKQSPSSPASQETVLSLFIPGLFLISDGLALKALAGLSNQLRQTTDAAVAWVAHRNWTDYPAPLPFCSAHNCLIAVTLAFSSSRLQADWFPLLGMASASSSPLQDVPDWFRMPRRPVMYLHRREHGVVGGRTRMLSAAGLAIFESLPGLLVRSLASADIAANEFVNF